MPFFTKSLPASKIGIQLPRLHSIACEFPLEIIIRICTFLPVDSLVAYGNTSGVNRIIVQDHIRRVVITELSIFVKSPKVLLQNLANTQSIVSGSVALAAVIPFKLRNWRPIDLDIYTIDEHVSKWFDYIVSEGYRPAVGARARRNNYGHCGIREVVSFTNSMGIKIDIVITDHTSALTPIFNFYGSHVINAITGHGVYCAYPTHTLHGRAMLNAATCPPNIAALPFVIQKCMVKYFKRGYHFATNAVIAIDSPHFCTVSKSCPHTVRDSVDNGALRLAFNNNVYPKHFVSNTMGVIFPYSCITEWTIGGTPCILDQTGIDCAQTFSITEINN